MRIEPLGDAAYILRDLDAPAYIVSEALNAAKLPGLTEAVASYDTVGIYVSSDFNPSLLSQPLAYSELQPNLHRIPVCYQMGEDSESVCESLTISNAEIAELHASVEYTCAAIGFCPGFPYLEELPRGLQGIPRRSSPRPQVAPGSVAITGSQTAVYPLVRPGGWALIGRTPLTIVDVADEYFPIRAGDRVSFYPIDEQEFEKLKGERL